jgi:Transcriptional regulator containing PAS, AAA-type ATPase, and DNA-binding domains
MPAARSSSLARSNSSPTTGPDLLLGHSPLLRNVVRLAEEVADTDVTVLVEGESGTGKELVARLIHRRSRRAARPFVFVNCAALTETLVEAELFGHARGSFTGAIADKPGRFHLAHGGTLFLDEIADLGPKGQGALLRVLEDGAFRTVGGTELQRVDVRVISATNRNLTQAVTNGKFREDLFYRLQIVPISLPPLRERTEDIPLLVDAFLDHFSKKHRRPRPRLSPEALELCQGFPWPGNVRQLRNIIERLVVTRRTDPIAPDDLPAFIRHHDRTAPSFPVHVGMTLADVEKLLISRTLAQLTSNRTEAARLLGISRRALQYKLKRYGLLPR